MSGGDGLQPGTIVVTPACGIGEIVKRSSRGRARGYDVHAVDHGDPTLGTLPHFMDEGSVRAAVVGVNVCPRPRGACYCGMTHATAPMLARLSGQAGGAG